MTVAVGTMECSLVPPPRDRAVRTPLKDRGLFQVFGIPTGCDFRGARPRQSAKRQKPRQPGRQARALLREARRCTLL